MLQHNPMNIEGLIELKSKKLSKKETLKLKRINFLQKLEKERKQSKPGSTLLDFTSLKTTLGGVWEDVQREKTKRKRNFKISTRRIKNLLDVQVKLYLQVVKHPEFEKNPFAALKTHIQEELAMKKKSRETKVLPSPDQVSDTSKMEM